MGFNHVSVLLDECVEYLDIKPGGVYVDGTVGGGGHAFEVCGRVQRVKGKGQCVEGRFVGIDRDEAALRAAGERLSGFPFAQVVYGNFKDIKEILGSLGIGGVDGAMLDLGVSSHQLDEGGRGFSYNYDTRLDMRMDRSSPVSAFEVVNGYDEKELTKIIFDYGEERYARSIAREVVKARGVKPVATTFELSDIIKRAIPPAVRFADKHPAKRTFQAIRIEVNGELSILEGAVRDFVDVLKPGGRLLVITFHSLEDRIVKKVFAGLACGCVCPKEFPVCVCGKVPVVKMVTKKPVVPGDVELSENYRAHSAKLRVVERI